MKTAKSVQKLHAAAAGFNEDLDFSAPTDKTPHIRFHSVSTHDEGHGRIEDRDYAVNDDVGWLRARHPDWQTIRSIGVVESSREVKGETTVERRLYISSLPADEPRLPKRFVPIGE
jgi:hypothetical protein